MPSRYRTENAEKPHVTAPRRAASNAQRQMPLENSSLVGDVYLIDAPVAAKTAPAPID